MPLIKTIAAALTLAVVAFAAQPDNDWLIVPGQRIGPIESGTTHEDLARLFGTNNVEDKDVDLGNGPQPVTIVLGHDLSTALTITFTDSRITNILVCDIAGQPCKWHTKDGVRIGTSVPELEKLNGGRFIAEPWGSDIGGTIVSWEQGKLAAEFGEGPDLKLVLTLNYPGAANNATSEQRELLAKIEKQKEMRSDDSSLRKLRPAVSGIAVRFPAARS